MCLFVEREKCYPFVRIMSFIARGVQHSLFVLLKCEGAWSVSSALFPLFADGNGDFGGGGEADFVPEYGISSLNREFRPSEGVSVLVFGNCGIYVRTLRRKPSNDRMK